MVKQRPDILPKVEKALRLLAEDPFQRACQGSGR